MCKGEMWGLNISLKRNLFFHLFTAYALKAGKEKVGTVAPGLFACKTISFQHSFYGAQQVNVFASIGYTVKSSLPRNSATLWVESVTTSGFKVCVLEYGKGSNETAEVNYVAFQSTPYGSQFGSITFNYVTTGTQCKRISFTQVRHTLISYPLSPCTPVPFFPFPLFFVLTCSPVPLFPCSFVPLPPCFLNPLFTCSLVPLFPRSLEKK